MYSSTVFLLILGGIWFSTSSAFEGNPDNTLNVTCDCLDIKEKDLIAEIWSETFPDNLQSLTIQNCGNLVLNISTGEGQKPSFRYLTIRNVKNCQIVGEGSLPGQTTFENVKQMNVEVPLYGNTEFAEGVLQFTNVTIRILKSGVISLVASSLRKFSMIRVVVMIAERGAVTFIGSFYSILEIQDSTFYSVDGNFIACNVTSAVIRNNLFLLIKEGSFLLDTMTFSSLGNNALVVEDCAVKLYSRSRQMLNNTCSCTKYDSLKGKICVELAEEKMKKIEETSSDENVSEANPETPIIYYGNRRDYTTVAYQNERSEKVSAFVMQFGNRFLLLWFLAITMLILMFPIAYFTKICLCKIVDNAFPLDMKHKRLVDAEDI